MKKRIIFLTALISGLLAFPVFAEQMVGRVQIDISPSEDAELASGETYFKPEAVAMDSGYEVSSFSVDGKQNSIKKPYTYTISVKPESGHSFDSSTVVEVRGAYEMAVVEKSKNSIKIKANAYPFHVLKEPANFNTTDTTYSWDRVQYATGYDILVYYNNKNGDEKIAKKHSNSPKININSFNQSGKEFDHIAVRAVYDKNDNMKQYFASSLYVDSSGSPESPDGEDDEYIFNLITLKANGISKGSFKEYTSKGKKGKNKKQNDGKKRASEQHNGNQADPNAKGPGEGVEGWRQNGTDWYYEVNGKLAKGWQKVNNNWFFFDDQGKMQTNWQKMGESWYFFNGDGAMLTGWQEINGKWYYFDTDGDAAGRMASSWRLLNEQWYYFDLQSGEMKTDWQNIADKWYFFNINDAGFPVGAMEKNTVKDGYIIDANGVWQQ